MKNVFCSAGRDEIKPCFGFSLFELYVHRLYSYCMHTVIVQLLSNRLKYKFQQVLNILNGCSLENKESIMKIIVVASIVGGL